MCRRQGGITPADAQSANEGIAPATPHPFRPNRPRANACHLCEVVQCNVRCSRPPPLLSHHNSLRDRLFLGTGETSSFCGTAVDRSLNAHTPGPLTTACTPAVEC
mmetsp:Transcript_11459/g.30215  ORF Transcript_11459/g.30215 Transcript_11459/m.30215 type:complete len:105 (+) Transcript_11459:1622-1936(+)